MDKRILKEVRTTGFSYLRIPKGMLGDAGHALQLNTDAILLYAMLLDRARSASYAGHQIDSTGRVYIYFTQDSIQKITGWSAGKIRKAFTALSSANLIAVERQRCAANHMKHAHKIYVRIWTDSSVDNGSASFPFVMPATLHYMASWHYYVLPSSLLADGNISSKAVCLYAILLDEIHRNVRYGRGSCIDKADQPYCTIPNGDMAKFLSCSKRTITSLLKQMQESKWIRIVRTQYDSYPHIYLYDYMSQEATVSNDAPADEDIPSPSSEPAAAEHATPQTPLSPKLHQVPGTNVFILPIILSSATSEADISTLVDTLSKVIAPITGATITPPEADTAERQIATPAHAEKDSSNGSVEVPDTQKTAETPSKNESTPTKNSSVYQHDNHAFSNSPFIQHRFDEARNKLTTPPSNQPFADRSNSYQQAVNMVQQQVSYDALCRDITLMATNENQKKQQLDIASHLVNIMAKDYCSQQTRIRYGDTTVPRTQVLSAYAQCSKAVLYSLIQKLSSMPSIRKKTAYYHRSLLSAADTHSGSGYHYTKAIEARYAALKEQDVV